MLNPKFMTFISQFGYKVENKFLNFCPNVIKTSSLIKIKNKFNETRCFRLEFIVLDILIL